MNFRKKKGFLLVAVQGLLMLFFFLPIFPYSFKVAPIFRILGFSFAAFGLILVGIAIWNLRHQLSIFPAPRSQSKLVAYGIFKFSRHPIYAGILLFFGGISCATGSYSRILISLLIFGLFYYKSQYEEQLLIERFPAYKSYKNKTRRFF